MTGENYKLGSGAQGLTSQSQQIMKAFLLDQKRGVREEDRRRAEKRKERKGGRCGEESGGAANVEPLILHFYQTAEDSEYPD